MVTLDMYRLHMTRIGVGLVCAIHVSCRLEPCNMSCDCVFVHLHIAFIYAYPSLSIYIYICIHVKFFVIAVQMLCDSCTLMRVF